MATSPFATDFAQALKDFDFNVKTIKIFSENSVDDGQGGQDITPTLFSTSEGFIFPATAKEKLEAGRLITDQMFKILVFPIAGIDTTMKVVINGEDWNIRSEVDVVEDGSLMIIMAEKGVAQ